MPGPLARPALVLAVAVAAVLAVVGGLALRGPGVLTLLVTAAVVGVTAAGMAREVPGARRGAALDAGARAAGWTAGGLLVVAGLGALAGGLVTVLVAGSVVVVLLAARVRRAARRTAGRAVPASPAPAPAQPPSAPRPGPSEGPMLLLPPVGGLSARALGEEWLRTAALLDPRLDPVLRRAVVARRESVLDELERRDPAGFARWLADLPVPTSNPADHVRDLPAAGTGAT